MEDTKKLSDEELVQKSLQNVDYFGSLMERFEPKLIRYVLRISSFSLEEAEEIIQEVFLKTWKNLNAFSGEVKFSSWIYRITHNETISAFRKYKSRGHDQKIDDEKAFELIASEVDLPKELDQKLNAHTVRSTLNQMKEKYREVLILKFLEDKSYEEISDILQKPMGTVATLINRAKESFREIATRKNIQF